MKKYWFENNKTNNWLMFHYGEDVYDPSEYMISGEGEIHVWAGEVNWNNLWDYKVIETGIYLDVDMNTLLKDFKGEMES